MCNSEIRQIPDEWELTIAGLNHPFKTDLEKELDKVFANVRAKHETIVCVGPNGPIQLPPYLFREEKQTPYHIVKREGPIYTIKEL